MHSDMGDRLALQYGGSEAHKKVSKGAGKTKHGEFLTSIKRYYSNSFTDRVKQDAMNLFLGYFQPSMHDYALWDLETDYFLHNHLLHPPRPDVDAILLTSSSLFGSTRGASDDSMGSHGRESVMVFRPTIQDLEEGERHFKEIANPVQSEPQSSPDVGDAIDKYFFRGTSEEMEIKSRIFAIERIKKRLVEKKELVKEAEELWWRKAMMDFDNEKLWMKLPRPSDGMPDIPYYESFHLPHKLTSFDDELCQEFQYPIDATIFAAPKTEASGYWNRRRDSRKIVMESISNAKSNDDDDDDEGAAETSERPMRTEEANEFEFFSFARNLGQKARNIVGGLLQPSDGENQAMSSNQTYFENDRVKTPTGPMKSRGFTYSTGSGIFETATNHVYASYCDIGQHPEEFIDEDYGARPSDFEHAMWTHTISEDDVKGMEKLACESHIGKTIISGILKCFVYSYTNYYFGN